MSTPSPLQPQSQGALEEASSPKSRVRITVLTILALHVVVIGGLLLQGCDKRPTRTAAATNAIGSLPPLNDSTNYFTSFPGDAGAGGAGIGALPPAGGGVAQPGAQDPGAAARSAASTLQPPGTAASIPNSPGFAASNPGGLSGSGAGGSLPPASTLPIANASSAGQGVEYTIKHGDTVGALAKKYHVSEKAILEANPQINPKNLKLDAKVMIPPPQAVASTAPAAGGAAAGTESPTATGSSTTGGGVGEPYIVKQGDTLAKIAKKFDISVKQLRAANNLKGDRIVAKQKLVIPAKAASKPAAAVVPAAAARTGGQI